MELWEGTNNVVAPSPQFLYESVQWWWLAAQRRRLSSGEVWGEGRPRYF